MKAHIMQGGKIYYLTAGGKLYKFEDHQYCGPVVLGKDDDPLENQPPEKSLFWTHVNAWYRHGKKVKPFGNNICDYETEAQEARSLNKEARQ